jgi:hypothetical protein
MFPIFKNVTLLLAFVLSFSALKAQDGHSNHLQNFDGFSNKEYAAHLEKDGWPVAELNTGKNASYLTDDEKNMVLAMNLIRYDPAKYSKLYVYPRLQYFKGTLFEFPGQIPLRTREGIDAVRELYLELLETPSLPVFHPSPGMTKAANDHAKYMKKTGTMSHEGMGGMSVRVSKYGEWVGGMAENLHWGTSNAHEAIMSLMIDDGVKDRGHRINMLNPNYRKVGVGIDTHPRIRVSYVIKYANDYIEK